MNEEFNFIYRTTIHRDGSSELLDWLEANGFYEMPASTKYHLSQPGGLAEHSMNVYSRLCKLVDQECSPDDLPSEETIAIVGLLHDVCKTGLYSIEMRNRKNADGKWESYPFYAYNDPWCFGHGEGSVILISRFMKLTDEEMLAIRWHMGFADSSFKGGSGTVGDAFNKCKLAVLLNIADLEATYLDEVEHA